MTEIKDLNIDFDDKNTWPSCEEVIDEYLKLFRHSSQSQRTRKSCLNYFFEDRYFGYNGHAFEINKRDLIRYFDWLNHLSDIALTTKKTKWAILRSFIRFLNEFYDLRIITPHYLVKWKNTHSEPDSNKNVKLSVAEISKILNYLKLNHFQYYLIFRLFAETGCRKGGLIHLEYDNVNLKERYFKTTEKTGRKVYYFSKSLVNYLKIYIEERKERNRNVKNKYLFLSTHGKKFSNRAFNIYLKEVLDILEIEKNITCKTFRFSLNDLRRQLGCPDKMLKILLCHKVKDVNYNHYVSDETKKKEFKEAYDKYNPFSMSEL
jgi:integrase